ncbi:trypsin-like peptidase domain-containing protein [Spirochaetota bacterium]
MTVVRYTFLLLLSISIIIPQVTLSRNFLDEANRPSPIKNNIKSSPLYQLQNTFHKIYKLYKDSVVFISTQKTIKTRYKHPFSGDPFFGEFFGTRRSRPRQRKRKRKRKGLGTGFIISTDGYICTNHHVVANMDTVTVTVNNKSYKAKIIGTDPINDIALIKIKGSKKFKPVYLGNSDGVKIGDLAVAIGNPFGLDKTYTFGIISATGRTHIGKSGTSHIQTDATINPGNSGGPLINLEGEVIGINRAIYTRSGGSIGIGFAFPINQAKKTLIELRKYGKVKRGFVGVRISPMSRELARDLGLRKTEGALIGAVVKGGPASNAGLRVKDVVIKINGKNIKNYKDLLKIVLRTKIGKTLKFTVWRNMRKANFWITVRERP